MDRVHSSLIQIVAVCVWLGAAGFLSLAVAPALFAVLPSRTLAGAVVGRVLPGVFYSGIALAVLVLLVEFAVARGFTFGSRQIASLVVLIACAVAQFIISPRIARLRAEIGRPIEELALDDARRLAFGRLHGVSVAWLGVAMLAAIVVAVVALRTLHADAHRTYA
jgi:hypothetical protein